MWAARWAAALLVLMAGGNEVAAAAAAPPAPVPLPDAVLQQDSTLLPFGAVMAASAAGPAATPLACQPNAEQPMLPTCN